MALLAQLIFALFYFEQYILDYVIIDPDLCNTKFLKMCVLCYFQILICVTMLVY